MRRILSSQRETHLVTYQTGMPDRTWADIALVARDPGRGRASWFVPLTVVTQDFDKSSALELGTEHGLESDEGNAPEPELGGGRSVAALGSPRWYEIVGRGRPALLSYQIDRDGLSWVQCWTSTLDRGLLRAAASLFCAATGVRKARLDDEALKTAIR
jgi:hypothetical protein